MDVEDPDMAEAEKETAEESLEALEEKAKGR